MSVLRHNHNPYNCEDQTAQQQIASLEAQLADAQSRAFVCSQHTDELRTACHDLRNHMAALKLSLYLLQRTDDDTEQDRVDQMNDTLGEAIDLVALIANLQTSS